MDDMPGAFKHPTAIRRALHAIAAFEALKGVTVLAASFGLVELVHHDLRHVALALIAHLGMNPAARYPSELLQYADIIQNADLRSLLLLSGAYVVLRFAEAFGLWKDRAWAEWLGVLSGALYIPFELRHLLHRMSLVSVLLLLGNVAVVVFLAFRLRRRRLDRGA
jgi:uncharacterized membrane protein (DUF2068 family)